MRSGEGECPWCAGDPAGVLPQPAGATSPRTQQEGHFQPGQTWNHMKIGMIIFNTFLNTTLWFEELQLKLYVSV